MGIDSRAREPLARETVLAIDNVPLELPIASLGSRVLGALLDYFLLAILGFMLLIVGIAVIASLDSEFSWWLVAALILGMVGLHWTYFATFEILREGRTPGKSVIGARVVSRDGGTPGAGAFLLRTLVRDVDLLVGVVAMALDPLSRRLGDRLAGTVVVHETVDEEDFTVLRLPRGWDAEDAAVVEALLERAEDLDPERAQELASHLLKAVAAADPDFLPPRQPGELPLWRLSRAFFSPTEAGAPASP